MFRSLALNGCFATKGGSFAHTRQVLKTLHDLRVVLLHFLEVLAFQGESSMPKSAAF